MPWEAQEGAKRGQNRAQEGAKRDQDRYLKGVFLKLENHRYTKWSWKAFLVIFGPPWRCKNGDFALEGLKKSAFQEVAL